MRNVWFLGDVFLHIRDIMYDYLGHTIVLEVTGDIIWHIIQDVRIRFRIYIATVPSGRFGVPWFSYCSCL